MNRLMASEKLSLQGQGGAGGDCERMRYTPQLAREAYEELSPKGLRGFGFRRRVRK
jgi:hypothetical protein